MPTFPVPPPGNLPTVHADMYVEARYTCNNIKCKCRDVPVQVKARGDNEDLLSFVNRVRTAVYLDHLNNSDNCDEMLAELKLPVGPDGVTGKPVPN
jgi:hypothetical protein